MEQDEPIKLFRVAPAYDHRIGRHAIWVSLAVLLLFVGAAVLAWLAAPVSEPPADGAPPAGERGAAPRSQPDYLRLVAGPEYAKLQRLSALAPVGFATRRYRMFRLPPQRICADLGTALTGKPSPWNPAEFGKAWECLIGPWPERDPAVAESDGPSFFLLLRGTDPRQITQLSLKLGFGNALDSEAAADVDKLLAAIDAFPDTALPQDVRAAIVDRQPGTLTADGTTVHVRKEALDPSRLILLATYRPAAVMTLPAYIGSISGRPAVSAAGDELRER